MAKAVEASLGLSAGIWTMLLFLLYALAAIDAAAALEPLLFFRWHTSDTEHW
jgi:hypothetical protein